jgi:hypothetical protein
MPLLRGECIALRSAVVRRLLFVGPLVVACGGTVNGGGLSSSAAGGPGAFDGGVVPGAGGATSDGGPSGSTPDASSGQPYRDPGCPQQTKIQGTKECDPGTQNGCFAGDECVPYVDYGRDCHTETVGTMCIVAGSGVQGDDCTDPSVGCAAGYVCATSGTGLRCAALCDGTSTVTGCPPGLICVDLDVDGYYVCG